MIISTFVGGGLLLGLLGFWAYRGGRVTVEGVIYVLSILWEWVTSRHTISMAIFSLEIARSIYADSKGRGSKRTKRMLDRIEFAQSAIDRVLKVLPNDSADEYVAQINKSNDPKKYGPFDAHKERNRYGSGNDGVRLSLGTQILGANVQAGWDGSDGSADFKITI